MIAVLADDFTGAAELAGIAVRYGLRVSLCLGEVKPTTADVLVVSTDSRSMSAAKALAVTSTIVQQILLLQPRWLYKKTDSVLRGYVMQELQLQMQLCNQTQALLLPANPTLGRTIEQGKYLVNKVPVHEAGFAADPEFPRTSAGLADMLGVEEIPVLEVGDALTHAAVMLASAATMQDVHHWAKAVPAGIALAGAGDFFTALLARTYQEQPSSVIQLQQPFLYVCGTAFPAAVSFVQQVAHMHPAFVVWLSFAANGTKPHPDCVQQLAFALQHVGKVIFAIDATQIPAGCTAAQLRSCMADAVVQLFARQYVAEMFIEGGSTATSILEALQLHELQPQQEWERGSVRMKSNDCFISVKPGSYVLPPIIQQLFVA